MMQVTKHPRADELAQLAVLVAMLGQEDNADWLSTSRSVVNRELRMLEAETARSKEAR
jgi:hypothetical protein